MFDHSITHIDVALACKQNKQFTKKLALSDLHKLNPLVTDKDYSVDVDCQFYTQAGKMMLKGTLATTLELQCQRTLAQFDFIIASTYKLGIVEDDRFFKDFDEDAEPTVATEGYINLVDIIHEEILLNIPMIPKKPISDCENTENEAYYKVCGDSVSDTAPKKNPFAILEQLKTQRKD